MSGMINANSDSGVSVSTAVSERYAHTLLFSCPACRLPISVSHVSSHRNLEALDGETLNIRCQNCHSAANVIAASARQHFVSPWELPS